MLKIEDINVFYGKIHAIHDLSFHVKEGEIVTLIGANGAGKTTILKSISRILTPESGIIKFRDEDMAKYPPHQIIDMGMAHVPEGRRVFSKMSVRENLEMGAYIRKDLREIQDDLEMVFTRFPRLKERIKRWRTADASNGKSSYVKT